MYANNLNTRLFKNNYINWFFTSPIVEEVFFVITCATTFTCAMCHWVLEIEYKYRWDDRDVGTIDFRWVFVLMIIISGYYLIKRQRVQFDSALAMITTGLILVAVLDYHNERYPEVCWAWIIPMAYVVGKLAIGTDLEKINYRMEKLYFSLALGMLTTSFLDFLWNFKAASINGYQTEYWIPFWLDGILDDRCTYEFGFMLITLATGYLIYSAKRNVFTLVFVIGANLSIQKLVISVQGRENRLLIVVGLLIFFTLFSWDNWKKFPTSVKRSIVGAIIAAILFILVFLYCFKTNKFGLYDRYLVSGWHGSGGTFTNVRFSMDWEGFKAMLAHPTDEYQAHDGLARPHSMLLEYGRVYDLTVWAILTIGRTWMIINAIVFAFKQNKYSWIKYLFVPAFVGINLYYSMEPNGYAHRHFWMAGLLLSGMIKGWLETTEEVRI